jgi:hypothetical protein
MANDESKIAIESIGTIVGIVSLIIVIEVATAVAIILLLPGWADRGAFGSMFGAVGSLFSGLALAGVVVAILLQRQELSLQRQELALTRAELQRAADAQEQSARILVRQLEHSEAAEERRVAAERRAALPLLKVESCSTGGGKIDFELSNHGAPMADVEVSGTKNASVQIQEPDLIPTNGKLKLPTTYSGSPPATFSFELVFSDVRGERRVLLVTFRASDRRLVVADLGAA